MDNVRLEKSKPKRGIVIFDTRYGNTEKIARSFERGLEQTGIQTVCISTKDASLELVKGCDLIAIGAPTEWHSASKPMKEFLEGLRGADFSNKYGFAFDTKLDTPLSGSAARFIEKKLKRTGLQIIRKCESAIVFRERETPRGAILKDGEEKRFEQLGSQIGADLVSRGATVLA